MAVRSATCTIARVGACFKINCFKIYKICILLHRSDFKNSEKLTSLVVLMIIHSNVRNLFIKTYLFLLDLMKCFPPRFRLKKSLRKDWDCPHEEWTPENASYKDPKNDERKTLTGPYAQAKALHVVVEKIKEFAGIPGDPRELPKISAICKKYEFSKKKFRLFFGPSPDPQGYPIFRLRGHLSKNASVSPLI